MQKVTPFKKIFFSFFIVIVFFVFIELLSRAFIFFTTKKIESFSYGFNNNIQININHLIKLKIEVIDLKKVNDSIKNFNFKKQNKKNKQLTFWIFGGSTTKGNLCGDNSSSWPQQYGKLNENIIIENFGEDGMDSHGSLQKLQKIIINNEPVPDAIIWAHKFNEINVIYQNTRRDPYDLKISDIENKKRKIYYQILKIDVNLKNYFISYKLFKNILLSINRKINRNLVKDRIHPSLDKDDFNFASKNFKINTQKSIKISSEIGVEKFFLLSLPSREDYEKKMSNLFFPFYYDVVQDLVKKKEVDFLDLSNHRSLINNQDTLFCDEVHKTLKANIIIARLINSYIKEKL